MPWEQIENRLAKAFPVRIESPGGVVFLPSSRLDIDEWLTSAAETDEELLELDIPRIQFLQNRWGFEKLVQFDLEKRTPYSRRSLFAMNVGDRAYLMLTGGLQYQLIAAVEPRTEPSLVRAVISRLLNDREYFPAPPNLVRTVRRDLVADRVVRTEAAELKTGESGHHLSEKLIGWIGPWLEAPAGTWHQDEDVPTRAA